MNKLKKFFADKNARKETLKSILVGGLCTLLDFLVMALFLYVKNSENFGGFFDVFKSINSTKSTSDQTFAVVIATGLGFVLSFLLNYVLSVFFVFQYGNVGRNKKGFLKFLLFAACGFAISTLGQYIGYNLLGGNLWLVKIILIVIVFFFNYFTRKSYIFNIDLIRDEEKQIDL